eukprot:m.174770 g.174770  ORF g.174770 m.174770 type:complete len:1183 (-) comp16756_c0_seq1:120-3668(-)
MMLLRKLKLSLFNVALVMSVLFNVYFFLGTHRAPEPQGILPGATPKSQPRMPAQQPLPRDLAPDEALQADDDDMPEELRFLKLSQQQKQAIHNRGGFAKLQNQLAQSQGAAEAPLKAADDDDQRGAAIVPKKQQVPVVKAKAEPDRFNPPQCAPQTKIVYVKTHKTGSSTLTNIFHRYAEKHHLKVALPKGNTFLGWPRSAGIPKSYVPLPNSEGNYDVFCSAHTRYNHDYIADIVPNANHITILRDPVAHFVSSWSYWGVASHIKRVSGFDVTWQEFLEDPNLWFSRSLKGDRDLLHNSVAFDFGYEHEYKDGDADTLMRHLDTFTQVLITEYMDESLVLMKRKLCWELDDVVYYALKVNKRKTRLELADEHRRKILEMNWFDNQLYQHFNQTLWREIAQAKDFEQELELFRQRKAELSEQCVATARWDEEMHRKALMEKELTADQHQCHLAQMDSVAFVKYLKHQWGVADPECSTQGQARKQVVYVKTHKTGSSTLTNIFHRYAYKHNRRPVLPKNNLFLGYPDSSTLFSSYVKLRPYKGKDIYDMLISAHARYDRARMDKLVPNAVYVTVLRDPITQFMSSWKYWSTADHIFQSTGKNVSMEAFLANPKLYMHALGDLNQRLIHNSMAFDLGLDNDPTQEQVRDFVHELNRNFALVLITEHYDESLVMLRRQLCWEPEDIVYMALKVSKASKAGGYSVGVDLQQQIRRFNWADQRLFHALNNTLFERIKRAIGFDKELAWLQSEKLRYHELCKSFIGWGDDKHRKVLLEGDPDEDEEMCHMLMLDSPGFVKLLKEKWGRKDPECHTQGQQRGAVIHVPTQTHADSTFANVILRKAYVSGISAAFPKNQKSFGYPQATTKQAVLTSLQRQSFNPMIYAGFDLYFDPTMLRSLAADVSIHPMIEHPVTHFHRTWERLDVSSQLNAKLPDKAPITLGDFVLQSKEQAAYLAALDPATLDALVNPLNRRFQRFGEKPVQRARALMGKTDKVLIAEHLDESLLFMRRSLCWKVKDMLYLKQEAAPKPQLPNLAAIDAGIAKLSKQDMVLYRELNASLWRGIGREISFNNELLNFQAARKQLVADCKRFMTTSKEDQPSMQTIVDVINNPKTSVNERQCRLMTLRPIEFATAIAGKRFKTQWLGNTTKLEPQQLEEQQQELKQQERRREQEQAGKVAPNANGAGT